MMPVVSINSNVRISEIELKFKMLYKKKNFNNMVLALVDTTLKTI